MKPRLSPFSRTSLLAVAAISLGASAAHADNFNWGDTVSDNFTITASDHARVLGVGTGTGAFNDNSFGSVYDRGSNQDATYMHFDLSALEGTTISGNVNLNLKVDATYGGAINGGIIGTAANTWSYPGGAPGISTFTPFSAPNGNYTTGQTAIWTISNSTFSGFVSDIANFKGLAVTAGNNSTAHFSALASLTGTYTVGEVRVLNGNADWGTNASYDNGSNILSISGSNTVTGGNLSLATGTTLAVTNSATLGSGSFAGTILNNGTISYASSSAQALSGAISGTGSLTKSGNGTLTLSGANSYSGGTTLSTGTLIAELSTTKNGLSSGAVSVGSDTTLQLNNLNTTGSTVTLSNAFSGTGTLILNFAANTTARNTMFTSSSLSGFNGAIQLTSSSSNGDKLNLANIGTTGASLVVNSGQTVYTASGTNVFSGGTTISGNGNIEGLGAIRLESNSSFGGNVNLAADARVQGANTANSILAATVQSGASGTQTLTVDGNFTASGAIGGGTGTLAVLKTGVGNVSLSNTNTYNGGTTVTGGTLTLGHATNTLSNSGAVNVNGGTLAIGGNSDSVGALTLTSGSITGSGGTLSASSADLRSGNVSAILGGNGTVTKSTSGQVALTGANTFTGGINLNEGLLVINGDGALGAASGAVNMNGGTIKGGAITLGSSRTITLGASGGYFSNSDFQSWTINSKLTGEGFIGFNYDSSAGQSMTLASTTNDYSGETRIGTTAAGFWNGGAAILKLGATNALPYGAGKGNVIVGYNASGTAARLDLNGFSANINGLSTNNAAISTVDNSSASAATLTLGNGDSTATFGGVIQDSGAALSLVKTGSGTQTLTGVNTYAGSTTVSQGTLVIGAGGSIANTSTIHIASGASFDVAAATGFTVGETQSITGFGTVKGDIAIQGTLGIGASPGTMTFEDDLALGSTSVSNFEINGFGSGNYDLAVAAALGTQNVAFNGGILNLLFQSGFNTAGSVKIFDFDTYSGTGFTTVNTSGLADGYTASFDIASGTVTVIPEPSAALLGGLGMLALLRRRRA